MEDTVFSAHVELCKPRTRFIRSDAALYAILLVAALVGILVTHWLSARFGVLRLPLQVVLVVLLAAFGYGIYQNRLTVFRYTLTADRLLIERIVGARERVLADVAHADVLCVGKMSSSVGRTEPRAFHGPQSEQWFVRYRDGEAVRTVVISPSADLKNKLTEVFRAE